VLVGLNCDLVQGFVMSPPIAADQAPLVASRIEHEACRMLSRSPGLIPDRRLILTR
jgi:EAL domain-containing protein (putative c-di-GMP-specific phosphodiesterase class I)